MEEPASNICLLSSMRESYFPDRGPQLGTSTIFIPHESMQQNNYLDISIHNMTSEIKLLGTIWADKQITSSTHQISPCPSGRTEIKTNTFRRANRAGIISLHYSPRIILHACIHIFPWEKAIVILIPLLFQVFDYLFFYLSIIKILHCCIP